ncbi:hypothetical protein HZH68_002990 [Vespula germanica]|uniref:Uncharacterized protein n=1 Tax=Vespula germanica TaxID=30212 RepID=A0A834NN95_VESGE|nr:hypothetical protein HZH68_002990 [Vespula germanica]
MISGNRLRTTPYGNRQNVTGMRVEFVELKNEAHPYGVTALSLGARVSARFHAVRNGFRDLGSACNSIGNSRCLIPFAVYFSLTSGDPVIIARIRAVGTIIDVNEHALSFTTVKMTAAGARVSGSPANFRGRTMEALNAPAKVVSQYYIPRRGTHRRRGGDEVR